MALDFTSNPRRPACGCRRFSIAAGANNWTRSINLGGNKLAALIWFRYIVTHFRALEPSILRAFELSSQSLSGSSLVPHSWTRYHFFFLSIAYFGFYMTARYSLQWRRLMKLIHSWSIELELELAIRDGQSNSIDSIQFSKKWKFESNFQLNSIQFNCTATSK